MILIGTLVLTVIINFWILIAIIPLFLISIHIRSYFLKTLNELKRLEGICKLKTLIYLILRGSHNISDLNNS